MFKKVVVVGMICLSLSSVAFAGKKTIDPGRATTASVVAE